MLRQSDLSHSLEETWPCLVALGGDGGGDRLRWELLGTSGDGDEVGISNHLMGQKAKPSPSVRLRLRCLPKVLSITQPTCVWSGPGAVNIAKAICSPC